MRNYVTINGTSSNTLKGFAINTLPPITKPLMRSQIEEIDGRDGDLITELGYAAYDKQMEIGLYGNFELDKVISFFSGEGTITFSNEPEKFYYFKILNQIDYEKLLKFKTATITFHCQPYKYPVTESAITGSGTTTITNVGNTYAKPVLTIQGTGVVAVELNSQPILSIDFGDGGRITIDVPNLEAYDPYDNTLKNRDVTGDYAKLLIQPGANTLSFDGTITSFTITNYTRWI